MATPASKEKIERSSSLARRLNGKQDRTTEDRTVIGDGSNVEAVDPSARSMHSKPGIAYSILNVSRVVITLGLLVGIVAVLAVVFYWANGSQSNTLGNDTPAWVVVLLYTLLGAFAPALGCLPLALLENVSTRASGIANALTAGVMGAASFELLREGLFAKIDNSIFLASAGCVSGFLFISLTHEWLEGLDVSVGDLRGASAKKALLVVGVMTLHSFAEGLGIGVSFSGASGHRFGRFISIAIALHNIPEGMAIALSLVPKGESISKAIVYSVISSFPQPLIAVPAFLLVEYAEPLLPLGLGIAAGAMLWLGCFELIPDALEAISLILASSVCASGALAMFYFSRVLHRLEEFD